MWTSIINEVAFDSANQNMQYDLNSCLNLTAYSRSFRCYIWQKAGLSYGYNQTLPKSLNHIDSAKRPTGGGIVFHSPNDMVLSLSAYIQDPWYPFKLKELSWLKSFLFKQFKQCGIVLQNDTHTKSRKHAFCSHYHNPYEGYLNNQKILGIAARRFRDRFLIQCILHLSNSHEVFFVDKSLKAHMSRGLDNKNLVKSCQNKIIESIASLKKEQLTPWEL